MVDIPTVESPPQTAAPAIASTAPSGVNSAADDSIVWSWSGSKIRELVRSPELRRMHERWTTLVGKKIPRLNEFLDAEHIGALNNAMLLLRVPNDFVFVHHGAVAVKFIGTNLTGTILSERKTPVANAVQKVYATAANVGEPYYIRCIASVSSNQHFFLEQMVLPIAADERREVGFLLIYNAPLDDKSEVLKAIFDRSQIGMIAAASNHDGSGKLHDGRILMINARARKVMKLPDSMDRIQTVRDLGPWFRDGALWTKTNVVSEAGLTHIHYLDPSNRTSYRVTVEPMERFVLFSIIEVPTIQ